MKTSLSIDRKSPNPATASIRAGFLRALETMIVFIEKTQIPDIMPNRFRDDSLLWRFFVENNDFPLVLSLFEKMKLCDRITFHISYFEGFWDMRVNVKKSRETLASFIMHFYAETGRLASASNIT
ncbi:MAG TPA: hypothetical protein VJH25_00335 [Candidatus Paceibacterota bacterium]